MITAEQYLKNQKINWKVWKELETYEYQQVIQSFLKEYAGIVIDRCAEVADMEEWPDYYGEGGHSTWTIDRESIMKVKNELQ